MPSVYGRTSMRETLMPEIEIPDDYWTIRPAGFAARTAVFSDPFSAVARDLVGGAAPVLNGNDVQLRSELATADGDAETIRAMAVTNTAALATTPTSDPVLASSTGDGLATRADGSRAASDANAAQFNFTMEAPPDSRIAPLPGPVEQPPPTPGAGDAVTAAITALYWELLGRAPDGAGLANWFEEVVLHGHSIDWVREQIMASAEYQNRQGGAPPPPPQTEPPPSAPPPSASPPDLRDYVTRDELQQVMDHFETTITLVV